MSSLPRNLLCFLLFVEKSSPSFLVTLLIAIFLKICVYLILFYILRPLFRTLEDSLPLVILGVSQNPLLIIVAFLGLQFSFQQLEIAEFTIWGERFLKAGIIIALTYWIAQLFTQVIAHSLRNYAKKTEAVWDNVLVPILERLIPALTYIIGTFFFFQTLGIDLTGIWVAFGGLTFVLGFALRDILANFFSGLVLLIDTPFQFGDVISLPDGSIAVIKNIGLRVTKLYLIDKDCEVYTPNASLGSQNIVNLTRPTPHFATSINVAVKGDADQTLATNILQETVLGHPDTLGDIQEKLKYLEVFEGLNLVEEGKLPKKEAGKIRLSAEAQVNQQLQKIEQEFEYLILAIEILEKGGLEPEQIKTVQKYYQDILTSVGLRSVIDSKSNRNQPPLEENNEGLNPSLIGLIRIWYQAWLKDPDLRSEDKHTLIEEWETKIDILKSKMTKLSQRIAKPGGYETRLDNYTFTIVTWLQENFKESRPLWKEPTIRLNNISDASMEFIIKFYVDHIKLEHWERGYRVSNEVRREMVRRLKEAGIYNN